VPHFTTYGLDYDEEESEVDVMNSSVLSEAPPTPTPKSFRTRQTPGADQSVRAESMDYSMMTDEQSQVSSRMDDDTFEFKKQRVLPGAFHDMPVFEADDQEMEAQSQQDLSFLGERSAADHSDVDDEPSDIDAVQEEDSALDNALVIHDEEDDEDQDMVGAFPDPEPLPDLFATSNAVAQFGGFGTPKRPFNIMDDWAEQLQKTISPKKQDRSALRASQAVFFRNADQDLDTTLTKDTRLKPTSEITTSIELMHSLFGQEEARKSVKKKPTSNGFKV
jgi:nuclear pore complex protein Nup98-Nup96